MGLGVVVLSIGFGLVIAYIGFIALTTAFFFAVETWAALKSVTPIDEIDGGITKIQGTVRAADSTLPPAVSDDSPVVSLITRSKRGLKQKVTGSWEEDQRLLRMVPFVVEDGTGSVLVSPTYDLEEDTIQDIEYTTSVEVDPGDDVPESVANAFDPDQQGSDIELAIEQLNEADEDETDEELLEALEEVKEAETSDSEFDFAATMRSGAPQKFEEQHVKPGDEVHIIGNVTDDEESDEPFLTNGLGFKVLTSERSGVVLSNSGISVFFAFVALLTGITLYNLTVDLIPEIAALV